MIFTVLINIVFGFIFALTAPFRLLPDVTLPASWLTAVDTASEYVLSLNNFFPVTILLTVFGVFLAYEVAYFGMKLINWVIRKIPTIS
jgi:hypothetical protein